MSAAYASITDGPEPPRVAVIGTGVAGAACAAGLLQAGVDVTAFDKSHGVGGRTASRRATWQGADGIDRSVTFDHGCAGFEVTGPRFGRAVDRVIAAGGAMRWRQRVHAPFPDAGLHELVVPLPDMPALSRQLLHGVPLRLGQAVSELARIHAGWSLRLADGTFDGPFDGVVVAIPPAQAAMLLAGHQDAWATALAAERLSPCWTLMAVTDDLDWPWDAAEVDRGEIGRIVRNDRLPGRAVQGGAAWIAHATPAWSLAHLEDDPAQVREALCTALGRLLTGGDAPQWHHAVVHRWRYARRAGHGAGPADPWLDPATGLAVCGDAIGGGSVEAAWHSGDELARRLVASLAPRAVEAAAQRSGVARPRAPARPIRPMAPIVTSPTTTGDPR